MKAFHNDPKIKQTYLDRLAAHAKADELVKGIYWEGVERANGSVSN